MSAEGYTEGELDAMPDRIAATFSGKTVLITGGTGFMGKVLIEKLLRKSPDIRRIILIARSKRGKTPQQRLDELFHHDLFKLARETRGGVAPLFEQVTLVSGDMLEPDLGISAADRRMISDSVDIIIHAAATVRFDEPFKKVVLLNVRGTKLMLQLAKECKHLKLFMYVSTAYSQTYERVLEERPYPPPVDPHQIIEAIQWMDDETVNALVPKLLTKLPNSYAFTKALAEALVKEVMEQIPAIIIRPSIVVPIFIDPLPGWTDNINGPTGLLIGAGKGVIRTMYCKGSSNADFLPVDILINVVMMICWSYIDCGNKTDTVINCTAAADYKLTWKELINAGRKVATKIPFNGVAWYPGGDITSSRLRHNFNILFFQLLPAVLVDTLLFCIGYKPVLIKVQRRILKGFDVFEFYTNNQFEFKSDTAQKLRTWLNPRERRDYKLDAEGADLEKYFEEGTLCARRYILNEADDTLPAARRHIKVMYWVDVVTRCIFWGLILYWLSGWLSAYYSNVFGSSHINTSRTSKV